MPYTTRLPLILRFCLSLAVVLVATPTAWAQLTMSQVAFPGGSGLDISNYPIIRVQLRVQSSGSPVELQPNAFSITETNIAYNPTTVTYNGNGIHVLEWTANRFGFLSCTVVASYNGYTATSVCSADVGKAKGAQVVVQDSTGRNLPNFADFERVPVGATDTMKLRVVATEAALSGDPAQERPIRIESITTTRPEFTVIWKGSFSSGSLPTNIISPLAYRIDVICKPTTNQPLYDVLTVTFEGGMRTTVMLFANPPSYPRRTILALTSPNGGEYLAPCQEIPVKWTGMIKGFKAHLELTTDNGQTWQAIDSTADSTYLWHVPEMYSDSVRIRVYQKFEATSSIWLRGPEVGVSNIAYSADGKYLAAAYQNGTILEWDVVTTTIASTYKATNLPGGSATALTYVGNSRSLIAVLARTNSKGGVLQRFDPGTSGPVATGSVPTDMVIGDIACTNDGSKVYLLPKQAARIPSVDPTTLQETGAIVLSGTAASTTMNGSIITASLLSGEVVMYNSMDGVELRRSQTGLPDALGPYANRIATSLSGRLVAIAGYVLTGVANGPKEQRTFIYDMQDNRMVSILFREGTNVVNLGFSPSDAFLGLGFLFNPQFVVYDLVNARTLPPSGSSAGHMNQLTDIAFGPDAATVATSSVDSTNNLLLRRVSIPESDMSDAVFTIGRVDLSITPVQFRQLLVGTTTDTTVNVNVCNIGKVPAIFASASPVNGWWLSLTQPVTNDTVLPGECLTLSLRAAVRDTGLLSDTVELYACGVRFLVPVSINVSDRNLVMITLHEDFGDLCVGERMTKTFTVLRNADTIPVVISNVYMEEGLKANFRIAKSVVDTTIMPGQTLDIDVEFIPAKLGFDTATVIIRYENLDAVKRTMIVTGQGSGADITVSHQVLPFIPEVTERDVTIRNNSTNDVQLVSATITAGEPFTVLTPMPQVIRAGDSLKVRVAYLGGTVGSNVHLSLSATPCAAQNDIQLALYNGATTVSAPTVVADPRSDTTSIPITATITENFPYKGVRPFTGMLRVNPRLYLARSISSQRGDASIVSQDIVNGWREIVFTVTGWFEGTTEIARLTGYAGMAEVDTSRLWFDSLSTAFGSSVSTTYTEGVLRIIHPDPTRRIVTGAPQFTVEKIAPNPMSTSAVLTLQVQEATPILARMVDAFGTVVQSTTLNPVKGAWQHDVQVGGLQAGAYVLELVGTTTTEHLTVVVVR